MSNNTKAAKSGMTRLQELWEWQQKKKEQQTGSKTGSRQTQSRTQRPSQRTKPSGNIPRYMQPTASAKLRQDKEAAAPVKMNSRTINKSLTSAEKSKCTPTAKSNTSLRQPMASSTQKVSAARGPTVTASSRPTRTTVTAKIEVRPSRTIPVKQNDTDRKVLRPTRSNITQSGTVTKTKTQPAARGIAVRKPATAVKTKSEPKAAKSVKQTTTNPIKRIEAILKDAKIDETENNTQTTTTTRKTRKLAPGKTKPKPEAIPQQKRGRSLEVSEQTESTEKSERRGSRKRQRTDSGPQLDLAPPNFEQDDESEENEEKDMELTDVSSSAQRSFAPAGKQFTFNKPLTPKLTRGVSSSGQSSLESIAEQNSPALEAGDRTEEMSTDEVFSASPAVQAVRAPVPAVTSSYPAVKTPAARTPAATRKTPSRKSVSTPSCKYEVMHASKNRKLSELMKNATSPEEKLQILSQSPMVELKRNKNVGSWRSNSPLPDINMEVESTQEEVKDSTSTSAPVKKDVTYFKNLVILNTDILESAAKTWDEINNSLQDVSEEIQGEIRTTACQARLIIAERFHQFSGLISQCENKTGEKAVLEEDLDGFWDMIYFQVEDVLAKFSKLAQLKEDNWVTKEIQKAVPVAAKIVKKKPVKPTKSKGPSKFAAFRAQMKKQQQTKEPETPAETDDIAVSIEMPKSKNTPKLTETKTPAGSRRRSTRRMSVAATPDQAEDKTYSFRRKTMELTLDSASMKAPITPASGEGKLKSVTMRSASAKKSARRPTQALVEPPILEAFSSPVLTDIPSKHLTDISSAVINDIKHDNDMSVISDSMAGGTLPCMSDKKNMNMSLTGLNSSLTASPDLAQYLGGSANASRRQSRISLIRPQKSCSPSPMMVRAMMSASKSGKKSVVNTTLGACAERSNESTSLENSLFDYLIPTALPESKENTPAAASPNLRRARKSVGHSLHKQVLTKYLESPAPSAGGMARSPDIFSPAGSLDKLNLNDSTQDVVNDLVVFSPMPGTPEGADNGPAPLITPRRSCRLAKKRISLL